MHRSGSSTTGMPPARSSSRAASLIAPATQRQTRGAPSPASASIRSASSSASSGGCTVSTSTTASSSSAPRNAPSASRKISARSTNMPLVSVGFAGDAKSGIAATSASRVVSERAGSSSPARSAASVATTPAPPEVVTMPILRDGAGPSRSRTLAVTSRSSSDGAACAPVRSSTARKTSASVTRAPVCAADARAAPSVAPVFSTTACLPARRSASRPRTKPPPSRTPSTKSATARVASSAASASSTSPIPTSDSFPVQTTAERPIPASCARSVRRPATPPLCETTATPPAWSVSRKETPEAITQQRRVRLTRPGLFGPITRRPVRRASSPIRSSSTRPSGPVSE